MGIGTVYILVYVLHVFMCMYMLVWFCVSLSSLFCQNCPTWGYYCTYMSICIRTWVWAVVFYGSALLVPDSFSLVAQRRGRPLRRGRGGDLARHGQQQPRRGGSGGGGGGAFEGPRVLFVWAAVCDGWLGWGLRVIVDEEKYVYFLYCVFVIFGFSSTYFVGLV